MTVPKPTPELYQPSSTNRTFRVILTCSHVCVPDVQLKLEESDIVIE